MKVEEVKQITNKALEELAASLESGHSEALTRYLNTMALFSKYSLNNLFLIARVNLSEPRGRSAISRSICAPG
jgi:folate-binding Fe-S cluster repair protein YgfZ